MSERDGGSAGGEERPGCEGSARQNGPVVVQRPGYRLVVRSRRAVEELARVLLGLLEEARAGG